MSYDQRWHDIARDWLSDAGVPDRLIDKYTAPCAEALQDTAEEFVDDIADLEHDADEAALDQRWQQKIDEARGK
jgi:hypothetical protein